MLINRYTEIKSQILRSLAMLIKLMMSISILLGDETVNSFCETSMAVRELKSMMNRKC